MATIKKVLIVGGGSTGWMSAAYLSKRLKFLDITLIESKKISTIGVGESTLGHINRFIDALGLKDEDWMKFCNATYKTSIKFTDFRKPGTYFHYPFGIWDMSHNTNGIMDWFTYQAFADKKLPPSDFAEWAIPSTMMTDRNKLTRNLDNKVPNFNFHYDTAYHMDAEKFGIFLKEQIAIPNGVTHIQDTIVDVTQDETGAVSGVITEDGRTLTADLYIDATGFRKLLIEKVMKSEFLSFGDLLLNDRALAARVGYVDREKEMHSVTNCTAIESGWVWDIPLWTRRGTGYVHSSKFADREQAEKDFRKHLSLRIGVDKAEETEFNYVEIRHGVQKEPWVKNVCAMGLALGFVEPLESTGLLTTHENIMRLGATLEKREGFVNQFDMDGWNFAAREELEGFKQFVAIHYALSQREDTEYWRHVTGNIHYAPDTTKDLKISFRRNISESMYRLNVSRHFESSTTPGETFIITGMGLNPLSKHNIDHIILNNPGISQEWISHREKYEIRKKEILAHIETLPTHYEFLRDNIYDRT
jgi:flavin-dependent dehydrogenase